MTNLDPKQFTSVTAYWDEVDRLNKEEPEFCEDCGKKIIRTAYFPNFKPCICHGF